MSASASAESFIMSSATWAHWSTGESEDESGRATASKTRSFGSAAHMPQNEPVKSLKAGPFNPSGLAFGDRAKDGHYFVPFKLIQKYPNLFVGKANKDEVAQFFKETLLKDFAWDFFSQQYPTSARDPLLLVPTDQFTQYLNAANIRLRTQLAIPRGGARKRFFLSFGQLDTPRPRYLGQASDVAAFDALKKRAAEFPSEDLSQTTFIGADMFREMMENIYQSLKSKDAEKAKRRRLDRQKRWSRMFKRVQRNLGLREAISHVSAPRGASSRIVWDYTNPAPFKARGSVRFVCVDVEAWEISQKMVTEVGLAILDTEDIEGLPPGKNGEGWFPSIEAHHLRITERRNYVNHKYVRGCPEDFNFGISKMVPLKDINRAVGQIIGDNESDDTRPVILVGHDIAQDLKYLKLIGYNHWRVPHIVDEADTKDMHQYFKRSDRCCGLSGVCSDVGIDGSNYHNAGNDAVYTLQAMIAMAVKHAAEGSNENHSPAPGNDEWSDGDMDDGGLPERSDPPVEEEQMRRPKSNHVQW